jgi:hypothetical protein
MENRTRSIVFLHRKGIGLALLVATAMLASCSPGIAAETETPATTMGHTSELSVVDFPGVRSVALAATSNGKVYAAMGSEQSILIASSTDGGKTFSEPSLASADIAVHVLPVERPAIAVNGEDFVAVAWLEPADDHASAAVWHAKSSDGGKTFSKPAQVTVDEGGEIVMVQIALDEGGNPYLAWLNDGTLRFTYSENAGESFIGTQTIGNGACECCQPSLLIKNSQVSIAYRSLEAQAEGNDIRDIVVSTSKDGGQTFDPFSRVSDEHWYLNACPIAGPSFVSLADTLFIAWMDGRQSEPNKPYNGNIWLSISKDMGRSFSPNLKINPNPEVHQTMPSLAVGMNGRIHLAWELHAAAAQTISYAFSDDGDNFSAPLELVKADQANGSVRMPSLIATSTGRILLAWQDNQGAHIRSWTE